MKYNKKIYAIVVIGLVTTVGTIAIINGVNKEQPESSLYIDPNGEYEIYEPGLDYLGKNIEERAQQRKIYEEEKQKPLDEFETKNQKKQSVTDEEEFVKKLEKHSEYVADFNNSVITLINKLYDTQYETTKIYEVTDVKRKELISLAIKAINKLSEEENIKFKAYISNNYFCVVSENEPLYTEIMEIFENTNEEDMTLINDLVWKLNYWNY